MAYPHNGIFVSNTMEQLLIGEWNLQNIILGGKSLTQKSTYCMIPCIWRPRAGKSTVSEKVKMFVTTRGAHCTTSGAHLPFPEDVHYLDRSFGYTDICIY